MKKAILFTALILGVAILGCIHSLHSIYTEETLVFKPELVGLWLQENAEGTWKFSKAGEKSYHLLYRDKEGKEGRFAIHLAAIHLARVGELVFMDFFPEAEKSGDNAFHNWHFFPVHTFLKFELKEPVLNLSSLNFRWLENLLSEHPEALRHEKVRDRIILTASSKEIQEFLVKFGGAKEAFADPLVLKRGKAEVAPPAF